MRKLLAIVLLLCGSCGVGCLLAASIVQSARWPVLAGGTTTTTTWARWTDPGTYYMYVSYNYTNTVGYLDESGNDYCWTSLPTRATGPTDTIDSTNSNDSLVEMGGMYDGSDDRSSGPLPAALGGDDYVWGIWFKWLGSTGANQWMFHGDTLATGGSGFWINNTGSLLMYSASSLGVVPATNQWMFVYCRRASGGTELYWSTNGGPEATIAVPLVADTSVQIGDRTAGSRAYKGEIGDAFIAQWSTVSNQLKTGLYYSHTHPTNNDRAWGTP